MRHKRHQSLAAASLAAASCAALGSLVLPVQAAPAQDAAPAVQAGPSAPDAAFLRQAHARHALQESAARLARERSRDVRVLQFARRLQQDHAAARAHLEGLPAGQHLALARQPPPDAEHAFGLATLRGAAFDRHYLARAGVEAQREALGLVREHAEVSSSTPLARYAAGQVPLLERQLAAAEALQAQFDLGRRNFPSATPELTP